MTSLTKPCNGAEYNVPFSPELNYLRKSYCEFTYSNNPQPIQKVVEPTTLQIIPTTYIQHNINVLFIILCCIGIFIYTYSKFNKMEERLNKLEKENIELRKIMDELRTPKSSYM